jgi:STE24 endopeptidase
MLVLFLLVTLLGFFALDLVAKVLNLRCSNTKVPDEFSEIYDEQRYQRSQAYTRQNTWLDIAESSAGLGALLIFWAAGGFALLDAVLRSFHLHPVLTGLLYLGVLAAAREALALPFDIYQTFVTEQRFGFNRATAGTFTLDRLKEWALGAALSTGLITVILYLFEVFGANAWWIAWGVTAAISILLVYLAPPLILPLFYKLTPVPAGELRDRITELCVRQRFPVRDLLVIDGSRRSSKANAFLTGFGSNKRIALYDTLINHHSTAELVAILAHEIGHFKRRHILQHFALGQLALFGLFLMLAFCVSWPPLFAAFQVPTPSPYVGLALMMILLRPAAIFFGVLSKSWSRRHEYEADRFAVEAIGDAEPLIVALKRLSRENLSNLTPHWLLVILHYTHPPILARILALRRPTAATRFVDFADSLSRRT